MVFSPMFAADGVAFLPHGYCFLWQPELVAAHVAADAVIAASYLSIPAGLFVFVRRRKDLQHKELLWLFAAFIVACGVTHMFDILTLWEPAYTTQAVVKLITAGISAFTAISIWPAIPQALALPSPAQLRSANDDLTRVNADLRAARAELERRVDERTAQLSAANQQLAAREAYYRTLFQITPVMMHTLDRSGRVVDINELWIRHTGYAREEVIGRHASDFVAADQTAGIQGRLASEFWRAGFSDRIRYAFIRKDGSSFESEISAVAHFDGPEQRALSVVVDVTDREAAERELRDKAAELQRVNEGLSQFAYVASHDLQEPLRKIVAFSEVLARAMDANDRYDIDYAYMVMRDSALRARQLVGDLLAYSRATNAESNIESVDIRELVQSVLRDLSEQIRQAHAELELALQSLRVEADGTQLGQVLQNLISNAIKYHKPKKPPRIRVSAAAGPDEELRIEVADEGIGFDPKHAAIIFEPFKRLHTRSEFPGSGIGLAICKTICDRQGWSVASRSAPGAGATFQLSIPSARPM